VSFTKETHSTPPSTVTFVSLKVHQVPGAATRWNLTVQQLHTYYVLAGATPVLVHNSGGECVTTAGRGRAPEYHGGTISEDQAMDLAKTWLGEGYREVGNGRYISRDGSRVVRYGKHEVTSRNHHIHFEAIENGRTVENTSVEIAP
jgi:hypothetical protein